MTFYLKCLTDIIIGRNRRYPAVAVRLLRIKHIKHDSFTSARNQTGIENWNRKFDLKKKKKKTRMGDLLETNANKQHLQEDIII